MLSMDNLLSALAEVGGSDLHIRAGEPPIFRIHGKIIRLDLPSLSSADTKNLLYTILSKKRIEKLEKEHELDLAYVVPDVARYRINVFFQQGTISAACRLIPLAIPTIDEMCLPLVLKDLAMRTRGLILVTGPTGSGKSTTLAAIVNHINMNRRAHIITVEDPIEFLHDDKLSIVQQREVGLDTLSFVDSLRHIMRQNPDVILIGEMRDLETISLAVTAAETGHLVLATLHTTDAAQSVDRIIDVFPPEQQSQIRTQLSITLEAVISQTLVPRIDREGQVAAFEILIVTGAVRSMIRERKTHHIYTAIQTGADLNMQSLDQSLLKLWKEGIIDYDEALSRTSQPREFERLAGKA